MRLINLTGHVLRITDGESIAVIPVTGKRARVVSKNESLMEVTDDSSGLTIGVEAVVEQTVINIPPPADDTIYIVSGLVAAHANRDDVFAPGRLIRDDDTGRVTACRTLLRPVQTTKGAKSDEEEVG